VNRNIFGHMVNGYVVPFPNVELGFQLNLSSKTSICTLYFKSKLVWVFCVNIIWSFIWEISVYCTIVSLNELHTVETSSSYLPRAQFELMCAWNILVSNIWTCLLVILCVLIVYKYFICTLSRSNNVQITTLCEMAVLLYVDETEP